LSNALRVWSNALRIWSNAQFVKCAICEMCPTQPEVHGYGISADIREFLRIRIDTDVVFDNPTDTDSESLTANLHDKLRCIALYRYADCRMQTALCSIQLFKLVAR